MLYDDCVRFSEVGEVHREKLTEDTQTLLASGWRWLAERQLHRPIDDNDIAPSFDVEAGLTSAHA